MRPLTQRQQELVDLAHGAIHRSRYRWRTTQGLSDELGVGRPELFAALCAEAERRPRRLRYHELPSGRTLDVLWGVVADVGDKDDLPDLLRTDHPPEEEEPSDPAMPLVFVSHSHRDADTVVELDSLLRAAGLRPWLYTTDIEHEAVIIDSVRHALERCRALLVFVSCRSLGSLWVRKEFGLALRELEHGLEIRPLVVLDGNDRELLAHFGLAPDGPETGFDEYCLRAASDRRADSSRWLRQARDFKSCLDDYLAHGGRFCLYPQPRVFRPRGAHAVSIESWAADLTPSS